MSDNLDNNKKNVFNRFFLSVALVHKKVPYTEILVLQQTYTWEFRNAKLKVKSAFIDNKYWYICSYSMMWKQLHQWGTVDGMAKAINRLEEKGLIESIVLEIDDKTGKPLKKAYRITESGLELLSDDFDWLNENVDKFVDDSIKKAKEKNRKAKINSNYSDNLDDFDSGFTEADYTNLDDSYNEIDIENE